MKLIKLFVALMPLTFLLSIPEANAVIDANAAIVKVRTTCQEGSVTLDNCFTSIADLQNWIVTRNPSDASPLLVEIGPGTFGSFSCNNSGISLRGAGPDKTRLGINSFYGLSANPGCDNLNVESLTFQPFSGFGVAWNSNGSSSWDNVIVRGVGGYGWKGAATGTCGIHRWRSSMIIGNGSGDTWAYQDQCGEHWFFGSQVVVDVGTDKTGTVVALSALGGEYHFYGSNIRAIGSATCFHNNCSGRSVTAVFATGGSVVHIHGTGIDAIGKGAYDVTGIYADDGSMVHANGSGYSLQAMPGQARYRIVDGGALHLRAPYLWEQDAEPPAGVVSESGADMAVVTNTSDGQPHPLVYSSNCTSGWFDTVEGACRP